MESSLLSTQAQITEAIRKLGVNYKKDGPERKTADYINRKLDILNAYWKEYQRNHDIICESLDQSHSYFTSGQYEITLQAYESVRSMFESFRMDTGKSPLIKGKVETVHNPGTNPTESRPATPSNQFATPSDGVGQAGPSHSTRGTNSKIDEMLRKQSSNFRAFRDTVSEIHLETYFEAWEFEDVLDDLKQRWTVIDKLHWDIDTELNGDNKIYYDTYKEQRHIYNSTKRNINTKRSSVSHREKSTPQMEIPHFHGSYNQFISFRDLFFESIHHNPALSAAQKMQHLKGKVRGEAERLIQHLTISSDNYSKCWEILNRRYDNKRQIFISSIKLLYNLPNLHQKSLAHIKSMHDTTKECLHSISNLGIDVTSWDPLIVFLLSQKLDTETHDEYLTGLQQPREVPNLQEFLEFLENKFTILEGSRKKGDLSTTTHPYTQKQGFSKNTNNSHKTIYNAKPSSASYSAQNESTSNKNILSNKKCSVCSSGYHKIFQCKNFIAMTPDAKHNIVTKLKLCKNCLYDHYNKGCTSASRCRECNANHNTLLHLAYSPTFKSNTGTASGRNALGQPTFAQAESGDHNSNVVSQDQGEILLATALINVRSIDNSFITLRALVDQGSQTSIITERAAMILGLPRRRNKGVISGVGAKENICKGTLNITCKALHTNYEFNTDVVVMKTLIKNLPNFSFEKPSWEFLDNINLADPDFNMSRPIDLLLGADIYSLILLEGIIKGEPTQPIAQQTRLGWILCGNVKKTYHCNVVLNTDELQHFWEMEDIQDNSQMSSEDQHCVEFYLSTIKRLENGRYEVRLPMKVDHGQTLGVSRPSALAQFRSLERRFDKNKQFASDYISFMTQYQELGHMIPSHNTSLQQEYVIPHHAVLRQDAVTTKLRAVFNASAKTSTGVSLNDVMCRGPNLQQDLQSLILKWRLYPFAYTSDIEMMFRQININPLDQKYQKVLWRSSKNEPIRTYQLTTVTYGTKAAPFLALMTLKQLATDEKHRFPEAAQAVQESFYMDDYCGGSYTMDDAKKLKSDLIQLLHSGGFNLRKWASNKPELLSDLNSDQCNPQTYQFKQAETTKTLGLGWNPQKDVFTFKSNIDISEIPPTKRSILSDISKLYDPLGWLAPITVTLKILFQSVWLSQLKWDDHLPEHIKKKWICIRDQLEDINSFQITRWIGVCKNDTIELHGFCDASQKAYAAVVYCKIIKPDGAVVSLLAAKTRIVPPNKITTTPRLELSGALLLSNLIKKIQDAYIHHPIKIFGWIDSTAVLGWLQGDPGRWKQFVANRVRSITSVMPSTCWRYVNTTENPADCASRGLTVAQLKQHNLWWEGPDWLTSITEHQQSTLNYSTDLEMKPLKQVNTVTGQTSVLDDIIQCLLYKYGSFNKLTRILAWILRIPTRKDDRRPHITLQELRRAKAIVIKFVQNNAFYEDIIQLKRDKTLPSNSILNNLNPFLDNKGILRVGGRLRNANICSDMKHPIIIPHENPLTVLLINQAHDLTFHGGARLTLANLRQKYWIIGGNRAVKKQIRKCITCHKHNPTKQVQLMGDLPAARINPAQPFYHTGVDYTGFVDVKANKGRGIVTSKGYIVIFVCLVTKATHLEIVSDGTSAAFLSALRRMAARKGAPCHLYSDNGTNFVGANRLLQNEYIDLTQILDSSFFKDIADYNIQWHFNAPSWPTAGGLWERAVRSLKHHLRRVIGDQKLTFEEWSTLLAQIEACLNSRPLCALSEDPEDLDFLTPAHFLIGRPGLTIITTDHDARTRWNLISKIKHDLWNRWKTEYLTQLSTRTKWTQKGQNIEMGDLVIIHEDNTPSGKWAMGRVTELHPGKDGLTRVVTLKTKNGFIKRPIIKLSILPLPKQQKVEENENNDSVP